MGWPTKGTGMNYNSHCVFGEIYCRRCRLCEAAKGKNIPANKHDCVQNLLSGQSSESMEASAILELAINSVIKRIVSDDDNVMRAHLRYKNDNDKKKIKQCYLYMVFSDNSWWILILVQKFSC